MTGHQPIRRPVRACFPCKPRAGFCLIRPWGLAGTREEGKNLLGLRVYEVRGLQVLGAIVFLIALKGVLARC